MEKIIEVFKTDVRTICEAREIIDMLSLNFPGSRINFDLEDCDYILRVEGKDFASSNVVNLLSKKGFYCEALE